MSEHTTQYDEVWRSFKNGDKSAFEKLYRIHAPSLLNYGYKISSNRVLIEDSIQDLFIELWQNRERVSETTSVKFYLFKALRYKVNRNLKIDGLLNLQDIEDHYNDLASPSHEAKLIGLEVQSLQMENLRALISQLPKRQQEAINLRYYHNFQTKKWPRS